LIIKNSLNETDLQEIELCLQSHMFEKICQTVNMQSQKRVRTVTWEWREKEMEKVKWTNNLFFYLLSISLARWMWI